MEEIKNLEAEQELNEEGNANDTHESDESAGDPLDQIDDLEALRHEAKKYRGIATRKKEPSSTPQQSTDSPYMTKRDFQLANEKKATLSLRSENPEIDQNYDAIMSLYHSRRGKDTAEDIAEDIKDAYILWKARNPQNSGDSSNALSTITVTMPSGKAPKPQTTNTETDPRFKPASRPDTWY